MLGLILAILGALITGVLTALAISAAYTSAHLSLPTPIVGHVLALLLPLSTYLVIAFPSHIGKLLPSSVVDASAAPILLSILDAVLTTLAASQLRPEYLTCSLTTRWQALFVAKNADSIRTIQDALQCCGLWSNVDRAWPFPDRTHRANACLLRFDRDQRCGDMWAANGRFVLAAWISIGAYGLLVKAFAAVLRRQQTSWMPRYRGYGAIEHEDRASFEDNIRYLDEPPRDQQSQRPAIEEIDEARVEEQRT